MGAPDRRAVAEVVERIDEAVEGLARATPTCADAGIVVGELTQAARLARHGAWRLLGEEGPSDEQRADDLAALIEGQCVAWLDRSRPGGLSDSLAHLDPALASRTFPDEPT